MLNKKYAFPKYTVTCQKIASHKCINMTLPNLKK